MTKSWTRTQFIVFNGKHKGWIQAALQLCHCNLEGDCQIFKVLLQGVISVVTYFFLLGHAILRLSLPIHLVPCWSFSLWQLRVKNGFFSSNSILEQCLVGNGHLGLSQKAVGLAAKSRKVWHQAQCSRLPHRYFSYRTNITSSPLLSSISALETLESQLIFLNKRETRESFRFSTLNFCVLHRFWS